ncbi:hypothetical protein FKM82_008722 [Ascaphus truei]
MRNIVTLTLLLLLVTCVSTQVPINLKPQIIQLPLEGRITGTTFSLALPNCEFNDFGRTNVVYLLVAYSNATNLATSSSINGQNIPPYQNLSTNFYYLTLRTGIDSFPCNEATPGIRVLRVGSDTTCILNLNQPDCNGPLFFPGPYRVRFLVIGPNGTVVAETLWSDDIFLRIAQDPSTIDTRIRHHSAGMIVITTILSILITGLFAFITAGFFQNCSKICPWKIYSFSKRQRQCPEQE